eukprot:261039-Rhodomonas_salina.3
MLRRRCKTAHTITTTEQDRREEQPLRQARSERAGCSTRQLMRPSNTQHLERVRHGVARPCRGPPAAAWALELSLRLAERIPSRCQPGDLD